MSALAESTDLTVQPGLTWSPARADGSRVVYNPQTDRHLRLGRAAGSLLLPGGQFELDAATHQQLTASLLRHGLLVAQADAHAAPAARSRRLRCDGITSIQLDLGNPSRMLAIVARLASRSGVVNLWPLLVILAALGLIALAQVAPQMQLIAATPPSASVLIAVIAGSLASLVIHEAAHALVLTHHGGQVRRVGFMLFYFAPAAFCDVTDTWLLVRRRHRVQVAAAGLVANASIISISAIWLLWLQQRSAAGVSLDSSELATTLAWVLLVNLTFVVINLNPFVKLDGYWILATFLDEPNLRSKLPGRKHSTSHYRTIPWFAFSLASAVVGAWLAWTGVLTLWSWLT